MGTGYSAVVDMAKTFVYNKRENPAFSNAGHFRKKWEDIMRGRRICSVLLVLCLLLVLMPASQAVALESNSIWINQISGNEGVTIAVCADTAVASGVITITYNADALTFVQLQTESQYVLAHAVNDEEAGKLVISWIAPKDNAAQGGHVLMRLTFTGMAESSAVLTGTVQGVSGESIAIATLNMTGLQAAVMMAEILNPEDYTAESFAAVTAQISNANEVLNLEAVTQAQLDAAAAALTAAVENLEEYVPEPPPTDPQPTDPQPTDPQPTDPQPTDPKPTQPGSTPGQTEATQPSTQAPMIAPKRDNSWMLIALAVLGVVAVVAAAVILKKRGKK